MFVLGFLVSCTGDPSMIEGPVRAWDTLSVDRFVVSLDSAEAIEGANRWGLSSEPVVEVGDREGGADLFGSIHHMTMTSVGDLAVVDPQAALLYLFDGEGGSRAVAGGHGDGPGEFRLPFWVGECAPGSVFVYDAGNGRVSVFSPEGEFRRSFDLIEPGVCLCTRPDAQEMNRW